MADRFTIIANLGSLQSKLRRRGDDRAAALVQEALELIVSDTAAVDRYAKRKTADADRQRRRRSRDPGENPGESHVMSRDVTGGHVTHVTPLSPLVLSSIPRETPQHNTHRAREGNAGGNGANGAKEALLRDRVGADDWGTVTAFLDRRDATARGAWVSEMLADITGSSWLPADLVSVCRDDAALERPIATPKGLRVFLRSAAEERIGVATGGQKSQRVSAMRAPARDQPESIEEMYRRAGMELEEKEARARAAAARGDA